MAGDECVVCTEPITNPICPACLHEGVRDWLMDSPEQTMRDDIEAHATTCGAGLTVTRRARKRIFGYLAKSGAVCCITCGAAMRVCAYCYTQDVFRLLTRSPALIEEHLTHFNFDHGHQGWEREAQHYID